VALGGIDAHQLGIRVGNHVPLRLMAYKRSFRYLRTHLLASEPLAGELEHDRDVVFAALRAGRAYLAMDAVAPARGFRFFADGDPPLVMGDEGPAGAARRLQAEFPRAARIRLIRDGREIAGAGGARSLSHEVEGPGVYRVEAYLRKHGRERTWILSNPIYLR
jgi:hypothetical protein